MKNYKGLRVVFAEPVSNDNFHIKVYGDDNTVEDYLRLETGLTTTILFKPAKFTKNVTRVTLQYNKEGTEQAKVVSAWLIRQDGTEEYSDLSTFWGCTITSKEPYVTGISNVTIDWTVSNTRIFNLAGQRLSKPQKGINIIEGKKVVVK